MNYNGKFFNSILDMLPSINSMKGIFFYTTIAYFIFLILLKLVYKTDKEINDKLKQETESFNKKLEDLRKIKDKEARELLSKINHMN